MAYSIKITNKNSKSFIFQEGECKTTDYQMSNKLLKQSLPEEDENNAIVISLGRDTTVNVPFMFRATSGDAAETTHSSTVGTVQEKVDYFRNTLLTNGITDIYTIDIYSTAANITGIKGTVENFTLNFSAEKPNTLPGLLVISVGGAQQ